jgi:CHRD domain-containing protein
MRRKGFLAALVVGVAALGVAAFAIGGSSVGFNHLSEDLIGYQEVPAISTAASARFTADVSQDGQSISWQLTYQDLEGTPTQSHIHFGQRSVNGGIAVFLCANPPIVPPPGTQLCPTTSPATIRGTFDADDVIGPASQGIGPGEYAELVRAIDAGKAYANLHSSKWPGGEIRAQLNETGNPHD